MSEIAVYDNKYITVSYLEDEGIIQHTIHQPVTGQVFRDALMAGSAAMERYGVCKWLSDDRLNGSISREDTAWANENGYAPTIEVGWKYWANVIPEEILAADTLTLVIEQLYHRGLKMVFFTRVEEALKWLDSCEC